MSEKEKTKTTTYSFEQIEQQYEAMTIRIQADCRLTTTLVGGMPGSRAGLEAFVKYQLKLTGQEAVEAVERILHHEIEGGTRVIPVPEDAELMELETKSVNVIRRDEHGPFLGDWMVKACIKNAASRIGLFADTKGTKGDMAEAGRVQAVGTSLWKRPEDVYNDNHIYLRQGDKPAHTQLEFFKGKVSTPQGSKSIVTVAEVCDAGAQFAFEFRMYNGKVKDKDIVDVFAMAMIVGLGSARSFERGKFRIDKLTVERGESRKKANLEEEVAKAAPDAEKKFQQTEEAMQLPREKSDGALRQ